MKVFVADDARQGTIKRLEDKKIKFEIFKSKSVIARELKIDFEI